MNRLQKFGAFVAISLTAGTASAELPSEATAAITAVQTDGLAMIAAGWPVLAALTGGFIVMKLFKRVANKAT